MNIEPLGFCDTNIFVDFSLIPKFQDFIDRYKRLNISDAVYEELKDWSRNYYEYSFIYDNLIEQINCETFVVIKEDDFPNIKKLIVRRRLESVYSLLEQIPQENKKHLNKGEIVSAVYAEVIGSPFIQSNDNFPGELKSIEFGNIIFYNRMDILRELCNSIQECSHFDNLINLNRKKMDKSFVKSKKVNKAKLDVDGDTLIKLLGLKDELDKL